MIETNATRAAGSSAPACSPDLCLRRWPGIPADCAENEHKCGLHAGHEGPCVCGIQTETGPCGATANSLLCLKT